MPLWQKCIVVLLGVVIFGGSAYFTRIIFGPPELERYKAIPRVTYVHPTVKKLKRPDFSRRREIERRACNSRESAHHRAEVPVTRELRDLLGDINTQIFFSKEPSPRKTEYTVKRGDALASIARKLESSTEAIIRVNDLDSTLIRPGEKLLVPRLDFTITIDLPRNRVVVHDSRGFFTQYPIVSAELPLTRHAAIQTKVTAKSFWENSKPVRPIRDFRTKAFRESIWGALATCFMASMMTVIPVLRRLRSKPTIRMEPSTLPMRIDASRDRHVERRYYRDRAPHPQRNAGNGYS